MSNSLFKLIDYSLIPAALMVVGKLVGIFLIAGLFSIHIEVRTLANALFAFETLVAPDDLPLISSYSDLFAFALMAFGFAFILISALYFHESHMQISTLNKLAKFDMLSLIKGSFELYHSGFVWLIFLWLANLLILINVSLQRTYLWTFIVTSVFAMALTIIFLKDLLQEVQLARKKSLLH